MKAFRATVMGRVQMVMYRDFALRSAQGLGIAGTVSNLSDGTVEVVAEGEKDKLSLFFEELEYGPKLAQVEKIDIEWREPTGTFNTFTILF
jgi:acylphosphatase